MKSGMIHKIQELEYLILLPILALAFYITFIPHLSYPYAVHIDDWTVLAHMGSIQQTGQLLFEDPFTGQAGDMYSMMSRGFHLIWAVFQFISGLSWMTIARYFPSIIFMVTVLSVYVLARREGFGWEAAFFASLMMTTVGILGPAFLIPVAMGLLFIPLTIFLAFNFRHFWAYLTIFIFTCFLLSMHAPTAICMVLILVPYILIKLKSEFWHSLRLTLALGIPFLGALAVIFDFFLQTARELLEFQPLPQHIDFPHMIADYGYLPIVFGLIGTFVLAMRGTKKGYALVLGLLVVLLMESIYFTLHYGIKIVYWRGLVIMMLILNIIAGAGLMWVKELKLPKNIAARLKLPLISRNIGRVLCLVVIFFTLVTVIPSRHDIPYYHMIDDYDYEAFVWIRDNIDDDYDMAILDPWKATAFTAITHKKVFSLIHSFHSPQSAMVEEYLAGGCTDTDLLIENDISIIYSRLPCSNPDVTEVRENIYLLREMK